MLAYHGIKITIYKLKIKTLNGANSLGSEAIGAGQGFQHRYQVFFIKEFGNFFCFQNKKILYPPRKKTSSSKFIYLSKVQFN